MINFRSILKAVIDGSKKKGAFCCTASGSNRPGGVVRYDARKVCLRLGKRLLVLTDRISIRDLNRHRRATRVSEEVPILEFWRDEGEKSIPYTSSLHE